MNLRGEYGPPWDGPVSKPMEQKEKEREEKDKMAIDESSEAFEEAKKEGVDLLFRILSRLYLTAIPQTFTTRSGHYSSHLPGRACSLTQRSFRHSKNR